MIGTLQQSSNGSSSMKHSSTVQANPIATNTVKDDIILVGTELLLLEEFHKPATKAHRPNKAKNHFMFAAWT